MSFLSSPKFHLVMSWVWALLVIPTLLLWKSSILWVASMSLYANFIGHWSAYQAARAERTAAVAQNQNGGSARNAGAEWLPARTRGGDRDGDEAGVSGPITPSAGRPGSGAGGEAVSGPGPERGPEYGGGLAGHGI